MNQDAHFLRVQEEIKQSGVSAYGRHKDEAKQLATIIHQDEHIKGIAYGRYENGAAMLVATDKRVIFLDKKPLFQTLDELTYDVISGIKVTQQALFSSLVLYTRVGNYKLRYVNIQSATKFKKYLESHLLEHSQRTSDDPASLVTPTGKRISLDKHARRLLQSNHIAVLSSLDRNGNISGAAMYYYPADDATIYMLTKTSTHKAHNVYAHPQVALTMYDEKQMQTLQLRGVAEVETDMQARKHAFSGVISNYQHGSGDKLPVFQMEGDDFIILRMTVTEAHYSDFGNRK